MFHAPLRLHFNKLGFVLGEGFQRRMRQYFLRLFLNFVIFEGLIALSLLLLACGNERTPDSQIMKIIGENSLTPVDSDGTNVPEKLRPLLGAFGVLEIGCTVTHIGRGLVLTAGHCIPQTTLSSDRCLSEELPGMSVRWGYVGNDADSHLESKCLKLRLRELTPAADFALLWVENPPLTRIEPEIEQRGTWGDTLTIFSHPKKRPLEWSGFCGLSQLPAEMLLNISNDEQKDFFAHQCDTEGGSSGAAVVDAQTLKIIGVHHGGRGNWNTATWLPGSALSEKIKREINSDF